MLTPVVFRDEAIPAHWKEILKNGGQIFRRNFAPLRGVAVRAKKIGLAVMPVDFMEGLLAIGTGLALVPIVDHVPDHATFRVGFNLREACLSAILALRPTRALIQTNVVFAERRFAGSVDNIDVHGGMVCRFGASDDALAAIARYEHSAMVRPKATATIISTAIAARIKVGIFMGSPKPAGGKPGLP
jgi:hypothetical protein